MYTHHQMYTHLQSHGIQQLKSFLTASNGDVPTPLLFSIKRILAFKSFLKAEASTHLKFFTLLMNCRLY